MAAPPSHVLSPQIAHAEEVRVFSVDDLITLYAKKYGVSRETLYKTIECESNFVTDARGDGGKSRGLSQIHSDYWPEITDDMADDPSFAVDFMAKKFSEGKGHLWTCFRSLSSDS